MQITVAVYTSQAGLGIWYMQYLTPKDSGWGY